ncbi:protein s100-a16 [Lynx pardinus]|uniref:Protein s100-a16 n=1 Tax=Lynx pardinus TaxID=191816 RepID=A0A485MFU3_LYNPA|nr:protein s100-a16 [Lynx pardinus]
MADCYTELEKAVVVLVENFYKYVSKHSLVKNKISKSSFRKMLQKELNHMLTTRKPRLRGTARLARDPRAALLCLCPCGACSLPGETASASKQETIRCVKKPKHRGLRERERETECEQAPGSELEGEREREREREEGSQAGLTSGSISGW